jgi:hypothetical protein
LWLFGIETIKRVFKDCKIPLSDETEEVITKVGDELTFDEVQSVFHNWMPVLHELLEMQLKRYEPVFSRVENLKIGGEDFLYTLYVVKLS